MRVTRRMIDPELRTTGTVMKALFRPSERLFRLMYRFGKRVEGRDVVGLVCEQRFIPPKREGTGVRVRVYRSGQKQGGAGLPGVVFIHGGGYAIGNPEGSAPLIQSLIETRDCVVVAPDYRKSLVQPYPAALDDCYATLLWLEQNAAELGVRDDQLIVMGQSAGGGLTAAVTLMARDRGEVQVASQFPLYPMIDDRIATDSALDNDAPVWSARHNRLAWDLYLGDLHGDDVPKYAAPARETDYAALPPTTTFVGELDPFRDETLRYVEALRAAGVPTECRTYPGAYHGFDMLIPGARVSQEANRFLLERFAAAVDGHFAKQRNTSQVG